MVLAATPARRPSSTLEIFSLLNLVVSVRFAIALALSLALSFVEHSTPIGAEVEVLWGTPGKPQTMVRAIVKPAPYKTDYRKVDLYTV